MVQPEVLMPPDEPSSSKNKVAVYVEDAPQDHSDLTRKNVPQVPEILGSDCESIDDLIFEFLRDRSPTTARSYKRDLEHFFAFTSRNFEVPKIVDNKIDFNEIKRVHVVKYKAALETEPNSRGEKYAPNSIGRKISSTASFFQFLRQRELIDKNPCEFVKRPPNVRVCDFVVGIASQEPRNFSRHLRMWRPHEGGGICERTRKDFRDDDQNGAFGNASTPGAPSEGSGRII